jgi:hypothetical protein
MGAGAIVLNALKAVGKWVAQNPTIVMDAADKVMKLKPEDKVNQLGAAVLELDQKIDTEMVLVRKQLRTIKIILFGMGITLVAAIIAIIILAI